MKKLALMSVCLLLIAVGSHSASANVLISGDDQGYNGDGVYVATFTVENTGSSQETIGGFTIPLVPAAGVAPLPESPSTSLSDIEFTPNPLLEAKGGSTDFGAAGFSITANDLNGSPLILNPGESAVLFQIPINALAPFAGGDALGVADTAPLSFLLDIVTNASVDIGAPASLTPVPSPTGVVGLCSLGLFGAGAFYRRRRKVS